MTSRKYPRLSDGYHERSPFHPYQSSGKYPKNHVNSLSETREEMSVGSNSSGNSSRGGSPSSRSYTSSPRTYRSKPSHGRSKESNKKGSSRSPDNHHSSTYRSNSSNPVEREYGKNNHAPQEDDFPWSQHVSSSGKVYYYNCKTEKSQWEKPKEWIEREIRLAKDKEKRDREILTNKDGRDNKDIRENSSHPKEYKSIKDYTQFKDSQYSKSKSSVSSTGNMSSKSNSREHYQQNDLLKIKDANKFNSDRFYGDMEKGTGNSETLRRQEIVKTPSAHTSAIPTTVYRSIPFAAVSHSDPIVSPAGSLQDVSPPATPSCATSYDSNAHSVSPKLNSTPPTSIQHHPLNSPSLIHHQPVTTSTSFPHNTPAVIQSVNYLPRPAMEQIPKTQSGFYVSSQPTHMLPVVSQPVVNYNSQLSAPPLHPLQQATLLQQRKMSEINVIQGVASQPLPISVQIPAVPHNDGIPKTVSNSSNTQNDHRQTSSSCPVSPVGFIQSASSHHFLPISAKQVQSAHQQQHPPTSPLVISPLPSPTPISLQSLGRFYDKNLVMNTIVSPQIEIYEKQALKAWDETIIQSEEGLQMKGDLLQSQLNLHLTDLKGDVGNKRIVFLREQTRTLEALLSESNTKSLM